MAKTDNFPASELAADGPSRRFVTLVPADVVDLPELPKYLIVNCTSTTLDGTVVVKDVNGASSTLTFVTGFNVVWLRPSRVVSAANAVVIACY